MTALAITRATLLVFAAGIFVGSTVGLLVAGLLAAAKRADEIASATRRRPRTRP